MRIAHFADLHIGFSHLSYRDPSGRNLRQVDFEKAALLAAKKAIAEKVDLAVIAGDFLHDTNMYPAALSGAVSFCNLFRKAEIPLLAIGGNHDEAEGEGRYNALRFLEKHHGLDLRLEQSHLDKEDVRFHFVSFRVLSRAASGRSEIQPFLMGEGDNILVAHGYTPGQGVPVIPEDFDVEIPSDWLEGKFRAAFLGHIHHHGEVKENVFYAGSTERRNFGEAHERCGFYIHNLVDGQIQSESIFLDTLDSSIPREMIYEEVETSGLTPRALDRMVLEVFDKHKLHGSIFRLVLNSVSPDLDRSRSQSLWEKEFRTRGGLHFEALARTKKMEELLNVEFSKAPSDIVRGFVDFIQEEDADLKEEAGEIMQEAREKIMAQEGE
jgi:DNA repair exonuclease SbcCD nuclease subunit